MSDDKDPQGLLSKVAAVARRVLGDEDGGGGLMPMELPDEPPPPPLVGEDFQLALKGLLNEDEGRFKTKLHLVSLVEFREAVGERWKKVAEKVTMIAEGVINRHLGPGNVYGRQGQDFYVLVFRGVPPEEGRRRAVTIAEELGRRLLGNQFQGSERPQALAVEIAAAQGINADGSLNMGKVQEAIGEVRSLIAESATDKPKPLQLRPIGPPAPDAAAKPRTGMAWKTGEQLPKPITGWQAIETEKKEAPPPAPAVPYMPVEARLSMLYRPTWTAEGEAIGAYKAHVQRVDHEGAATLEGSQAYPKDGGNTALALDRFAVAAAIRDVRTAERAGMTPTVIIPVHWSTVASGHRMSLLAPFADLPEASRRARLVIDLFGVPDWALGNDLGNAVKVLSPLCRFVLLRGHLTDPRAAEAAAAGCGMVGLDLSELAEAERTDDAHLLAGLERFRGLAAAAGLSAAVWGVRRRPAVIGAVLGGFAMVNGPGLMKDIAKPAKVLPAPKARFAAAAK